MSAVEHVANGLVYAIHTHGDCTPTGGINRGTAIDHPGLQAALGCPTGVCADGGPIPDECQVGACCSSDGTCSSFTTELACTLGGGSFAGPDSVCTFGDEVACCLAGGTCDELSGQCCTAEGGTLLAGGAVCDPASEFACCQPDGSCVDVLEECCTAIGGLWFGADGTTCPVPLTKFFCPSTNGPSQGS